MNNELWTEKYRPDTLDGYVFTGDEQKEQIESWIKKKSIPHLLFSGGAGLGKTTLAKILINLLEVDPFDVLEINASRENGVDAIRDKITGFVQTMPFGDFKIVLLDEADYITPQGQAILRGVMEMYHVSARFILTCNYPNRVIPALHSRTQGFHIEKIDQTEFTARVAQVLITEDVTFDLETLDTYVKATYPDLRKCLNTVQQSSINGELKQPGSTASSTAEYKIAVVELFKKQQYSKGRELLCASVRPEDMEENFRWFYDNLDLWGDSDEQKDQAILVIRTGLVNHSFVADPEINLSACLIELCGIRSS